MLLQSKVLLPQRTQSLKHVHCKGEASSCTEVIPKILLEEKLKPYWIRYYVTSK